MTVTELNIETAELPELKSILSKAEAARDRGDENYAGMPIAYCIAEISDAIKKKSVEHVSKGVFQLRPITDLTICKPKWLIRGLLEEDSLDGAFGQTGSMKTFLVMDMGLCVATGKDFHGRETAKGVVIYIVGEGQSGIMRRATAWAKHYEIDLSNSLFFVSVRPAALLDDENVSALAEEIVRIGQEYGEPVLIIFDTLNRNMGGGDENSTADMTGVIAACDRLRALYSSAVMLVHHTGHQAGDRARGSSVYRASLDAEYRCTKTDPDSQQIKVDVTKLKDGVPPPSMHFDLEEVNLGITDDDGYPLTSAVLIEADASEREPKKVSGKWQLKALEVVETMYTERMENLIASGNDPEGAYVTESDYRSACYASGMPRNRYNDAKKSLISSNHIEIIGDIVQLKNRPVSDRPSGFLNRKTGLDGRSNQTLTGQNGRNLDGKPVVDWTLNEVDEDDF